MTPPAAPEAPAVVLQRKQKTSRGQKANPSLNATKGKGKETKATGPNNVAGSPQAVQAGALAAVLASSQASAQALAFYRVPLFLLPIYKAAAVQYGVPWQILAAINEIETDYGNDQSVSSAGAVGWMQFMPVDLAAVRGGRVELRLRRPLQPRRRDLRGGSLPARGGRRKGRPHSDLLLQPLRRICQLGDAPREADLDLPDARDRHPDRA